MLAVKAFRYYCLRGISLCPLAVWITSGLAEGMSKAVAVWNRNLASITADKT